MAHISKDTEDIDCTILDLFPATHTMHTQELREQAEREKEEDPISKIQMNSHSTV